MVTAADRGKEAEKLVLGALNDLAAREAELDFERLDDARSSSGHNSKPRTGDFVVYYKGCSWTLEVKQVAHEFRLPKSNFPLDQRARLKKRRWAGGFTVVLVYFTPLEQWRIMHPQSVGSEMTGSWDLSAEPLIGKKLPGLLDKLREIGGLKSD